ncbi:MFS transporter [Clostridium butyricum]|uniref:Transporter, major facilitator family n=1 Tax=Clostridium butyricum E4 str. BoNT E BL5262 TaxID=632245 RepID=C4IBE0_CLOBU|nr:MFS transporter [Clostridium butyricum]EEP56075.1 transporter, major facilitator family [Clostridium butyricum E4 str. BoNT E BL5262]NFS18419.1 MFS transporter [Clostridium butyricum]
MKLKENYNHTIYACYIGYITQAIVNNFAPLLFLTFQSTYNISIDKIAFLVTINFGVQLIVDFLAAKFVDRIGYRVCVVGAHIFSVGGLVGLAILPQLFSNHYIGLLISIFIYAIGGGLIEVLISPIVEACPTEKKEAAMSLLHSFYCWGHAFVIIITTIFFTFIGISHWRILSCLWALVPLINAIYFANVPIQTLTEESEGMSMGELFKEKIFWILLLLMVCAGASEQAMSQWASAFAEAGLNVTKTIGDLAGPCAFAILMGCSRLFYSQFSEKIKLNSFMMGSAVISIISYLMASLSNNAIFALIGCGLCGLSAGIFWPGTFSIASKSLRKGGTAMFALLALAGDVGCSIGPTVVGTVSGAFQDNLKKGFLSAIIFPIFLIGGLIAVKRKIIKKRV